MRRSKGDASLSCMLAGAPGSGHGTVRDSAAGARHACDAPAAVLVAQTREAYRPTPRPAAAMRRTVDVATVAAPAENHLVAAEGTVEQGGRRSSSRPMRTGWPRPNAHDTAHTGRALHGSGGAAPAVATRHTGPAPHRSQQPQSTPCCSPGTPGAVASKPLPSGGEISMRRGRGLQSGYALLPSPAPS